MPSRLLRVYNNIRMNRIIIENNEPKIVLTEETEKRGYVTIEEARSLLTQSISAYCKSIGMED